MTQSNRDIPMAPRERPMPHEGPPTSRDREVAEHVRSDRPDRRDRRLVIAGLILSYRRGYGIKQGGATIRFVMHSPDDRAPPLLAVARIVCVLGHVAGRFAVYLPGAGRVVPDGVHRAGRIGAVLHA